jgi:alpha-L-rhamnosidase
MLTGGAHVAKIAVVWPINSIFATYKPQERTPENTATESGLNLLTDLLLRLHHDFDYIDEEVLAAAQVKDGMLHVADEAYELVVLPPMSFVRERTIAKLEELVAGGGHALGILTTPSRAFDADSSIDVTERTGALFGRPGPQGSFETVRGERAEQGALLSGPLDVLALGPGEVRDRFTAALGDAIASLIAPDFTLSNPEIFALHRRKDGGDIYFLVNTTFETQKAVMTLPGGEGAVLWDPTTGERGPASATHGEGAGTTIDLTLPPVGSIFVVTGPAALDATSVGDVRDDSATSAEIVLDGPWAFAIEDDNGLVIKKWIATQERDTSPKTYAGTAVDESEWQPMIAGAWSYQLPAEPEGDWPMAVWYRAGFEIQDVPDRLALLIDGFAGSDRQVWLNGKRASGHAGRSRLDSQMKDLDLTSLVQAGRNVLAIRLTLPGTTSGILDHIKLLGSFGVAGDEDRGYKLSTAATNLEPRSWTQQGFPFFSGCAVYSTTFELPSDGSAPRVTLDIPMIDDVVEVIVNGERAGIRLWDPYVVDISTYVQPGDNDLALRVANTPANLLNGVTRPSGFAGPPRLLVGNAASDSPAAHAADASHTP